jgi:hypothetical protein
MAEIKTYQFELREVTEALIKKEGINKGRWMLHLGFNYGAGNIGPDPANTLPGTVVQINQIGLTRVGDDAPPFSYVVDAAVVNPTAAKKTPPRRVPANTK